MKKKIAILVTSIVLAASLSACGSKDVPTEVAEAVESAASEVAASVESKAEEVAKQAESTTETKESKPEESKTEETKQAETTATTESKPVEESKAAEESKPAEIASAEPEKPAYTFSDKSATMYAKSSVNVRDLPSTDGSKVGSLSTNEEVAVTGVCNETGWYRFTLDGKDAYVSGNYLVSNKVTVASNTGNAAGTTTAGAGTNTAPATNTNTETTPIPVETPVVEEPASTPEASTETPNYGTLTGKEASGTYDRYVDDAGNVTYVDDEGEVKQTISADKIGGGSPDTPPEASAEDLELFQKWQDAVNSNN